MRQHDHNRWACFSFRHAMKRLCHNAILTVLAAASTVGAARADVFVLKNQGEIRGELVNKKESPRKSYVVKTASGGHVMLDVGEVAEVRPQSAAEIKYDRYRGDCPNTVDGHWKMAQWCKNNRLTRQRDEHLQLLLEIDPDHEEARHALGYSQINGRWVTQAQVMVEGGYIRSKYAPGKWILPQEEELLATREKVNRAQLEWNTKLKRWGSWIGTDKASQAIAGIQAIDDPLAVRALKKFLEEDNRRDMRLHYVKALGRVNTPAAMDVLVGTSLFDKDEEIRIAALDEVVSRNYRPSVGQYVQALKNKDNQVVNRAGVALGQLKDESAIGPLIDALVTNHTYIVQKGQPGQTSATFGNAPGGGGGGFSFGGSSTQTIKRDHENHDVLQALVEMTGGTSFNYDVKAWKYWYIAQKKPATLDARRDGT
jgi:hypothetical protein